MNDLYVLLETLPIAKGDYVLCSLNRTSSHSDISFVEVDDKILEKTLTSRSGIYKKVPKNFAVDRNTISDEGLKFLRERYELLKNNNSPIFGISITRTDNLLDYLEVTRSLNFKNLNVYLRSKDIDFIPKTKDHLDIIYDLVYNYRY